MNRLLHFPLRLAVPQPLLRLSLRWSANARCRDTARESLPAQPGLCRAVAGGEAFGGGDDARHTPRHHKMRQQP